MFSEAEKNRRLSAVSGLMEKEGLSAIYLPGNSSVGTHPFGSQRYFTDNRVIFFIRSVVLLRDSRAVAVVSDLMGKLNLIQSSFINDAVINEDQVRGVIEILRANGVESGRVGTIYEILPAAWLLKLRDEFPDLEFVDVSDLLLTIRSAKSAEEVESQRVCARIAEAGYRAICETVKPGMYENEVVAEMERAMQRMGAEESFALITSGKFSIKDNKLPPLHNFSAINRKIEAGDVVAVEITPRYNGYWTQIVRTVCVGEKNEDAEAIRQVIVGSVNAGKELLKAKTPICEIVRKMREYAEDAGYNFVMPCGHLAGIDLDEGDMTEDITKPLEPGMLVILHPTIITDDMDTSIFWGESYIVTEKGFEKPMLNGDALYVS